MAKSNVVAHSNLELMVEKIIKSLRKLTPRPAGNRDSQTGMPYTLAFATRSVLTNKLVVIPWSDAHTVCRHGVHSWFVTLRSVGSCDGFRSHSRSVGFAWCTDFLPGWPAEVPLWPLLTGELDDDDLMRSPFWRSLLLYFPAHSKCITR